MATALKDLYNSGPELFDQIILPDGYLPGESEEFMNPLQRAYFLHKLRAWKDAIISESRATNGERVLEVETTYRDLTRSANFFATPGPASRWYLRTFDNEKLTDICQRR